MTIDTMIRLGQLALQFGRTDRATLHEDGITPESDTDHTVMLQIIACQIAVELGYDVGLVSQYALVHDLVEAKTEGGDTNSFDIGPEEKEAKDAREEVALTALYAEYEVDSPWLCLRIQEYEAQAILETRLVRYLDKALPKITHMLNGCAAIQAMGKTHEDLVRAHVEQLAALNAKYPELAERIGPLMANIMKRSEDAWEAQ